MTFEEARQEFERVFQIAAAGETVLIERDAQRVTVQPLAGAIEADVAPPGYFADDYSQEDVIELNSLASQAPQVPLP